VEKQCGSLQTTCKCLQYKQRQACPPRHSCHQPSIVSACCGCERGPAGTELCDPTTSSCVQGSSAATNRKWHRAWVGMVLQPMRHVPQRSVALLKSVLPFMSIIRRILAVQAQNANLREGAVVLPTHTCCATASLQQVGAADPRAALQLHHRSSVLTMHSRYQHLLGGMQQFKQQDVQVLCDRMAALMNQ
jgi:hypothetical protein